MEHSAGGHCVPTLTLAHWNWDLALRSPERSELEAALGPAIASRRWFGARTRRITSTALLDAFPITPTAHWLLVWVTLDDGTSGVFQVPLAFHPVASGEGLSLRPAAWIDVHAPDGELLGHLDDAVADVEFCRALLRLFLTRRPVAGGLGQLQARANPGFEFGNALSTLTPRPVGAEQSNSSIIYGDQIILKLFRRVETGLNPDFELSQRLTARGYANTPQLAGTIEYGQLDQEPWTLGLAQAFVPNEGDAWRFTLHWLAGQLSPVAMNGERTAPVALPVGSLCEAASQPISAAAESTFGEFLSAARILGKRTAEMHLALADSSDQEPDFAPEPFTPDDVHSLVERGQAMALETLHLLREHLPRLPVSVAAMAGPVLAREQAICDQIAQLAAQPIDVHKIRCHNDYHLGQVLASRGDFFVIDFEGEPARPLAERRRKQLALRDVAGMIRSFHYASCTAANAAEAQGGTLPVVEHWTRAWYAWTSVAFLSSYLTTTGRPGFLPQDDRELDRLLNACLLEKAVYELRYELNNRPDWVYLPLEALRQLAG